MTVARATAFRVSFPLYDSTTGLLKSGVSPSATVSLDGGNYAAVTDAPVEIQTSGTYEFTLTAAEMTADLVTVKITASGALSVVINIQPDTVASAISSVPASVMTYPIASAEGSGPSFRSLFGLIAKLTNRTAISGDTLTVYKTDDSTPLATQALGRDASAVPVVSVDTN